MQIKSAVIWNTVEELEYFVCEKDLSKFQGVYINSVESDETLARELSESMYDEEGNCRVNFCDLATLEEAVLSGARLIECGFLP